MLQEKRSCNAHHYLGEVFGKVSSAVPRDEDVRFRIGRPVLPAVSAIATISAASTAAAVPATTAASATMAAATAAVTTTASAAPTAASATSLSLRPRFIHYQVPPAEILSVQRVNSAIRIFVALHLHEGKTARLARKPVTNQIDTRGSNTNLREPFLQLLFRRGKREIADVELLHLPTPSARNPSESRGAR
jgi:hypothetical protein